MSEKKKICEVQFFRPKGLKRIIQTAKDDPTGRPNLEDLKGMAEDTIDNAPEFIQDKAKLSRAIVQAEKTITDVEKEKGGGNEDQKKPL